MLYSLSPREKVAVATVVAVALTAAGVAGYKRLAGPTAPAFAAGGTSFPVQVAGAVREPGIVRAQAGMVVSEAIEHSGGATGDADTARLNLAAQVVPNSRLYVPMAGESVSAEELGVYSASYMPSGAVGFSSVGQSSGALVNINTADESVLDKLPGVGPVTAKAILDHRSKIGRFTSVEQLLDVKGIGPKKLEKMRPYVTL